MGQNSSLCGIKARFAPCIDSLWFVGNVSNKRVEWRGEEWGGGVFHAKLYNFEAQRAAENGRTAGPRKLVEQ